MKRGAAGRGGQCSVWFQRRREGMVPGLLQAAPTREHFRLQTTLRGEASGSARVGAVWGQRWGDM